MGKPGHKDDEKGQIVSYDATVLDWAWEGTRAMSEKESTIDNPKYKSTPSGQAASDHVRAVDRQSGLAASDPAFRETGMFSPNHVGAPWLEMIHRDANGEESVDQAQAG